MKYQNIFFFFPPCQEISVQHMYEFKAVLGIGFRITNSIKDLSRIFFI